jgi:hypothetical protein
MKRLDEIPKKTLFEVPEGYFEKLPGRIQARISKPVPLVPIAIGIGTVRIAWNRVAVRYALPLVMVGAVAALLLTSRPDLSPEDVIASIESEQLVAYLEDTEVNTDELLDAVTLETEELEQLELDAMTGFEIDDTILDELESLEPDTARK